MFYMFNMFNILVIFSILVIFYFFTFFLLFLHFSFQAKGNQNIDTAMHNFFYYVPIVIPRKDIVPVFCREDIPVEVDCFLFSW